jgi:hypothetical protein
MSMDCAVRWLDHLRRPLLRTLRKVVYALAWSDVGQFHSGLRKWSTYVVYASGLPSVLSAQGLSDFADTLFPLGVRARGRPRVCVCPTGVCVGVRLRCANQFPMVGHVNGQTRALGHRSRAAGRHSAWREVRGPRAQASLAGLGHSGNGRPRRHGRKRSGARRISWCGS